LFIIRPNQVSNNLGLLSHDRALRSMTIASRGKNAVVPMTEF